MIDYVDCKFLEDDETLFFTKLYCCLLSIEF